MRAGGVELHGAVDDGARLVEPVEPAEDEGPDEMVAGDGRRVRDEAVDVAERDLEVSEAGGEDGERAAPERLDEAEIRGVRVFGELPRPGEVALLEGELGELEQRDRVAGVAVEDAAQDPRGLLEVAAGLREMSVSAARKGLVTPDSRLLVKSGRRG